MQRNMMIAVEAAKKYNIDLARIFAAIDAGLLVAETGIVGLTYIDETRLIELIESSKPQYIQTAFAELGGADKRIEPAQKGRRST